MPARRILAPIAASLILVVSGAVPASAAPRPGTTTRVSVGPGGVPGNGTSANVAMSADGRFLAFTSGASNLIPDDTNGATDVFVLDRSSGEIERVSRKPDGSQASGIFGEPSISGTGRFVTFLTTAKLTASDTNTALDVYLLDRETDELELASVDGDGEPSPVGGTQGDVSDDGRYVSFATSAAVVSSDQNGTFDVYVRDRVTGEVELASATPSGTSGNDEANWHDLSGDGRSVAFDSGASDLVAGDQNGVWDVFVRDLAQDRTRRASVSSTAVEGNANSYTGYGPVISRDGRIVTFLSYASNLVPGDAQSSADIFVRDLGRGLTERVSVAGDGGTEPDAYSLWPALSPDGRYVGFMSYATNLAPDDANGRQTPAVIYGKQDYFLHDRLTATTELVSIGNGGLQAQTGFINVVSAVSEGGRFVAFALEDELDETDSNAGYDVFVRDRGPELGVASVSAAPVEGGVDVTGWATFSGAEVLNGSDAAGDARLPGDGDASGLGTDLLGFSAVYRPERADVVLRWTPSELPGVQPPAGCCDTGTVAGPGLAPGVAGAPGITYAWEITIGGVRHEVRGGRAGAGAPPGTPFFAAYRCEVACVEVARLGGSIGGTGTELRTAVPLSSLGLQPGSELIASRAFTALGDPALGGGTVVDQVSLSETDLPVASVRVAAAPPDQPPAFGEPVALAGGRFATRVEDPAGDARVIWTRACLGEECSGASWQMA